MKKSILNLSLILVFSFQFLHSATIGLVIVATGKYIDFVPSLIKSAENFFCKNHKVTYFVFTDGNLKPLKNTICIYQERLGWPYDTMMRYHIYNKNQQLFDKQDYLFACDADMHFKNFVGDEILSKHTAVLHPAFVNKKGSYETNPLSNAYVPRNKGRYYFCGGFYGGTKEEFLKISKTNAQKIDEDLHNGIIAVWHDESHWNRYCIDHKPSAILSPSYCYPEGMILNFPPKLIALNKDHKFYRED